MAEEKQATPLTAKKDKWRTLIALIVSVAWLTLALWWTFYRPSGTMTIPAMNANEWGDWAAGTFAPLAFLWLVVGYFQQGEELRDNVRALHLQEKALQLQVQELKESVQQQTAMAASAARQAALLEKSQTIALRAQVLEHQPRFTGFRVEASDEKTRALRVSIRNDGRSCHDTGISVNKNEFPVVVGFWSRDAGTTVSLILSGGAERCARIEFLYRDELLISQTQKFYIELVPWPQIGMPLSVALESMTFRLPTDSEPVDVT